MDNCQVVVGEVTEIEVDAIAKLIPPSPFGKRKDSVDRQIWEIAGDWLQNQVLERLPSTKDGETIVVEVGDKGHEARFDKVIYVYDQGRRKLSELVFTALKAAKEQGCQSLAFPVLWRGTGTLEQIADEMCTGVRCFTASFGTEMKVFLAIGNDPAAHVLMKKYNR